ncbi:MAG: hypothetical protein ACYS3N_06340 [Planctomycetota bacterium]|jgi:hypothetical protein
MNNSYRVILIGLAVLGIVYAGAGPEKKAEEVKCEQTEKCLKNSTEPENKTKDVWCEPVDLCTFPASMEVPHYVQIRACNTREMKLVQVDCGSIGRYGGDFPCYKGSDVIEVRANFPAILNASIDKSGGDEYILKDVNLYWENGVNTIQGTCGWEELRLCLEAWKVKIYKSAVGTIKVGEITIDVRPADITQCDKAPMPRSSILVRSDVAYTDFVGTWTGQTTDKPDEGTTTDTMVLRVGEPSKSDWKASISGTFPSDGKQEVSQIQLVDHKIGFYVQAMDGKTVVWLGLHPREDDRLIGESFALDPDCDGRNIELTLQKEK